MSFVRRVVPILFSIMAIALIAVPMLSAKTASAAQQTGTSSHKKLEKGPVAPATMRSYPLHQLSKVPAQTQFANAHALHRMATVTSSTCPSPTLDLKVLVIASDGNEVDLAAIKQALDFQGTPYTLYVAAQTPNGLTPDKLSNGCHGYYNGVILTNGTLSYYNGTAWASALSTQEWTNLWSYESTMAVREVSWYTYPTADFGYQAPNGAVDTSVTPLPTALTATGQKSFLYLKANATISIQNAYTYTAQPLADGATTPMLSDASGNALAAVRSYVDGRQVLSLTFDSNPYLIHAIVLANGLINWVTKGLQLGERHVYMSAQIDDLFLDDSEWTTSTACGTPVDNTGVTYRITGSDLQALISWQKATRANSVSAGTTLTMAYNGYGTTKGAYTPDTLTPKAVANRGQFNWVSHTYNHTNLDSVDYATATSELALNNQAAQTTLKLTGANFTSQAMVTPDVSGLTNPNFLQAAYDQGMRYLVTDTSIPAYNNPAPNVGIYNTYQPQILMIPRHANNLFYNVSTPEDWVAEYNCFYSNFWGRNLSYQEILDKESQMLLVYLLKGDSDPWMFHQPNLRAYDGTHSLLGDLIDMTLQKYSQYYNLPIENPRMNDLGVNVASWMQYLGAGVTASIVGGKWITITAQKAVVVPVTGLRIPGFAKLYGGQYISSLPLAAGQSVTLPIR